MKDQYKETDTVRNIEEIQFGMLSPQDMEQLSHAHIVNYEGYRPVKGIPEPVPYGVVDPRMGVSQKEKYCGTCSKSLLECVGHFGYIDLPRPVFHVGYIKNIINILQNICKVCANVLLDPKSKEAYWKNFKQTCSYLQKKAYYKAINDKCKKIKVCPYCNSPNGVVKKAPFVQIIHEKFNRSLKKKTPVMSEYFSLYESAKEHNKEVSNYLTSNFTEFLSARFVLALFSRIPDADLPLLCMDHKYGHPKHLILTRLLVPPNCIRPSVISNIGSKAGTTEDGITVTITEILHCIENISRKQSGSIWDLETQYFILQLLAALLINSDLQFPLEFKRDKDRSIRGFVQRLKGKQGRFRGNLSGKRVDFSSRTVISPDPNLRINEVGVPVEVAMVLTYPEMVFSHNIELMRQLVKNGPDIYPGAIGIDYRSKGKNKKALRYIKRDNAAAELKVGDIVERHLMDGDVVLFNRQPSLHKMSIMSHQARVLPGRTFRFNECVCAPYNADFDGDEMNLHLPQTEEARAEAWNLMGVKSNLVTPRHGALIIGATQDFLTGSYLMTQKDQFFDKETACGLIASILAGKDAECILDLPEPAIIKPIQLWTGKQIFSLIMRPNKGTRVKDEKVLCNLITKRTGYTKKGKEFCTNEAWIIIRNSELLAGSLDKSVLGSGTKKNMFYVMLKNFGKDYAADCMWRVARVSSYYLMHKGFSIGIGDVMPGCGLLTKKQELLDQGNEKCDEYIEKLRNGDLTCTPGFSADETLESQISSELNKIRGEAGKICAMELHRSNSALIMAICGSKGSFINISQMIACVGQQSISGARVPNGFEDRSLPHFPRLSKTPAAKGFVSNSFFSGITPSEFIFHTMAGREGLVDTAVKTAETGYMQRRLVKTLEDLYVAYDKTIRDSNQDVVQICFGGDGLDPAEIEKVKGPIDFKRLLNHIVSKNLYLKENPLSGSEIVTMAIEYFKEDVFADLSDEFKEEVMSFLKKAALKVDKIRPIYEALPKPKKINKKKFTTAIDFVKRITLSHITDFLNTCSDKYHAALIEPGTAVGALCAQSIGEPGTQMTLKTFHFAGVAAMNITLGVPRILEIMNVSKSISTPVVTAQLVCNTNLEIARQIKGRIEKTTLGEICKYLEEVFLPDDYFLLIKLHHERIKLLKLEVDAASVKYAICTSKIRELKVRDHDVSIESETILTVRPNRSEKKTSMYYQMQHIKQYITDVVVKGLPSVNRAVILERHDKNKKDDDDDSDDSDDEEEEVNNKEKNDKEKIKIYELGVEGNNFREVMATYGVDWKRCRSNNTVEVFSCLGIAAARDTIIKEITFTMKEHGLSVDHRHIMLLADLMTSRGQVLAITRHGLSKMKDSILMLASFEKTDEHLFSAAYHGQNNKISGVSDCIILGKPMKIGTGVFKLLHKHQREKQLVKSELIFDHPEFHIPVRNGL